MKARALGLTGLLVFAAAAAAAGDGLALARAHRERHAAAIVREYAELLRLPNVATNLADVRRVAETLRDRLAALGARAELLELEGAPPVVFGRIDVPGATRTLALYVHYDGQPADPAQWRTDPWTPTLLTAAREAGGVARPLPADGEGVDPEWRLYARSASDDKAPLGALFPALAALGEAGVAPTSNLVFFFEGEEEAGSPHLGEFLARYRQRFDDVDVWLFLDGPVHASGRPQIAFGVRGVTGLELTVYGPARSLHSGHYGNWAPVPGRLLAELLATLYDEDGKVAVAGFYDSVAPLGAAERAALARLPNHDEALRRELGLAASERGGAPLAESLLLPSLTIQGLQSANVGPLAQNVIPATATANLGIRLVAGNDPVKMQELIEAHLARQGFTVVRDEPDLATRRAHEKLVRVVRDGGYPAARTAMDLPIVAAVVAAATRAGGGEPVLLPGMGGSLPLYLFTDPGKGLGKPCLIVPVANHDNNQHAPDENLRLANLWYAIDLYGALLTMP
ncbi:MAG: M20/M25/M40 family metallo-hydrolase [Thermoanaerobaculia bacterium]|nr:M20/M25/M40 family metallo-hydrolase [Thermoanaerobaculia bacterium]